MLGSAFSSFVLPGFGQGRAGARGRMIVFAALGLASDLALLWSVYALAASLIVRLLSASDAAWGARKPAGAAPGHELWLAGIPAAVGVLGLLALRIATQQFTVPSSSMYPTLEIGDHFLVDRASLMWRAPQRGEVIVFHNPCDESRDYDKRVVAVAGDTVEVRCELLYVNGAVVRRTLVDASCTYDDYDDFAGTWSSRPCTRYRETLGDHTYDVFGAPPGADPKARHDFPNAPADPPSCLQQQVKADISFDGVSMAHDQHAGAIVDGPPTVDPCAPSSHYVVPEDSVFVLGDNRANSNDSRYWGVVPRSEVIGRAIGVVWTTGKHDVRARFGDVP